MTPHQRETGHEYAPRGDGFCRTCGGEGPKERARRLASLTEEQRAIAREADAANRGKFTTAATDITYQMGEIVRQGRAGHLSRVLLSDRLGDGFAQALMRSTIASGLHQLTVFRALGEGIARNYPHELNRAEVLAALTEGLGLKGAT